MKLVITTQIRENYGIHDWDGKGECPQYWKCKGGDFYVVPNLSVKQVLKIKDTGIPTLKDLIESRNEGFEEYIVDWAILEDDVSVCEDWQFPFELSYQDNRWVAKRITINEIGHMVAPIESKTEQYDMLKGGNRTNYAASYTMQNGDVVKDSDVNEYLKKAA